MNHNMIGVSVSLIAAAINNPCAIENGGCLGLCLLKPKSHSCSCPNGLHLVRTGNVTRCQGMDKIIIIYNILLEGNFSATQDLL